MSNQAAFEWDAIMRRKFSKPKQKGSDTAKAIANGIRERQARESSESVRKLNRERAERNKPVFKTLPKPESKFPVRATTPERSKITSDPDVHRKSCFVALREMPDVNAEAYWKQVKAHYGIASRTELRTKQWAFLSAELQAAKRDPQLRAALIARLN